MSNKQTLGKETTEAGDLYLCSNTCIRVIVHHNTTTATLSYINSHLDSILVMLVSTSMMHLDSINGI